MPEEKKKSKIRFARPGRRICKVVLPELAVSVLFMGILRLGWGSLQEEASIWKAAGAALLVYVIAEVLLLRRFHHYVKSPTRYYCTNFLAFGILMVLAVLSACLPLGTLHTWLFLPFHLFCLLGWMGEVLSALVVGLLLFLIPVLYPPIHRWRKQPGPSRNQAPWIVLVIVLEIVLSLTFALVFMSGEVASKEPTSVIQGSTMQITLPETSSSVSVPSSLDLGDADPNEEMFGYALGAVLIFLVAEGVMLWVWNRAFGDVRICSAYLRINYPPFAVLILLGMASACFAPEVVHNALFLPFSLFRYGMGTGRLLSAFLVGCLMTLLVLLYAPVSQMIRALIAFGERGRPSLRRRITHRYHKWQWKRGHEQRKKERERQNKE